MLEMRLFDSKGKQVVATTPNDNDEWSMDHTFAEDGTYTLEVNDLLMRGGQAFAYWVDAKEPSKFEVSLKADAKTKTRFALEEKDGALGIDLQVVRTGYEGPLEVSVVGESKGLDLLNPTIPAKAKDAKIWMVAKDGWNSQALSNLRLKVRATEGSAMESMVQSQALSKLKAPHVYYPPGWLDGALVIAGTEPVSPFFGSDIPLLEFAKAGRTHVATFPLKRIQAEFKDPVTLLPSKLPEHWSMATKVDKDNYSVTLTRSAATEAMPAELNLLAYGEFKNRGRIETWKLPIRWIDPLTCRSREQE